jgi:ligand-binding sensor domain-containing protein
MHRLKLIGLLALLFAPSFSSILLAEPPISATKMDDYLANEKHSPLAGQGGSFLANGERYRVDPRLVIAIAGNETTFGKNITRGTFNAWNWLTRDPNFSSWEKGITVVTGGLRRLYFDTLKNASIRAIGAIYCGEGCENWENLVTLFYSTELGGDLSDLTYHKDTKVSWIPTNGPDLDNTVFTAALVNTRGELLAATNRGCFDRNALGVLRSVDRGASWTPVNLGFFSTNVRTLMLTPNGDLFAGVHDGVYRFDLALGSWNPSGLGGVDVNVLRATTRGLWAADSCFCTGIRQSTDDGQTWQRFDAGLPPCVNAIVEHPTTGDLYAGTGTSGVYKLPVGAVSWSPANEGLGSSDLHSLAVNASADLFSGTIQGLFRRKNGAPQWTALTQGLPNDGIQSIAFSPRGTVFVGTFSHGVYASLDNGDTWVEMNAGILDFSRAVGAIAFDRQGFAYVSVGSIVYHSVTPVN